MNSFQKVAEALTRSGSFTVGANYWASHAGTNMWADWRPEVVDRDFKTLSAAGVQVLRVFPLWPDFQPLTRQRGGGGSLAGLFFGEKPIPDTEAGQAGVDEIMIQRFEEFARLAEKHRLSLIVGLVTGWMSGRLFVPPAFESLNVLTDQLAIKWQVKFVKYFIKKLKKHPAIIAWDLGNECNCMGNAPRPEDAWGWTSAIAGAIRLSDNSRPVVSGMHSLIPEFKGGNSWLIQDQADLCDLLTTHPYPIFTPHAKHDPIDTIRTILHATAENHFYGDIGGKPCFTEETGTLGPMIGSYEKASAFLRSSMFSLWANDCRGLLWWCGFDQKHLQHQPYANNAMESELGLFTKDYSPKPMAAEFAKISRFIKSMPFEKLPERTIEAVCILPAGNDQWGAAYGSFILAKQAGFDIEFQYADQPLKDSKLYMVPSASGMHSMFRIKWHELLDKVKAGATLYLSLDDGYFTDFNETFGVELQSRATGTSKSSFVMHGVKDSPTVSFSTKTCLSMKTKKAEILGNNVTGNPVFFRAKYGKGTVYLLTLPVEQLMITSPGSFQSEETSDAWKIYAHMAEPFCRRRALKSNHPFLNVTEHVPGKTKRIYVLVNASPEKIETELEISSGWKLDKKYPAGLSLGKITGGKAKISIDANSGAVLILAK
ncbi:MAG TPA: beta-mannanase [Lentisphaeria bacterium]|nr:MAG: hypothetical protein A2X45_00575 [Lentisphaerae bacterium GWF2_50_93]HCE45976.1 beta-mannanase [Lentisphaeria bacterium]